MNTEKHTSPFFSLAERGHYSFNERQRSGQQDPLRGSAGDQVIGRCFICTHEDDPGGGVRGYGSTSRVEGVGDSGTAEGIKRKVILFVMSIYCRCVCVYVCISGWHSVYVRTYVLANAYRAVTPYLNLTLLLSLLHHLPRLPLFLFTLPISLCNSLPLHTPTPIPLPYLTSHSSLPPSLPFISLPSPSLPPSLPHSHPIPLPPFLPSLAARCPTVQTAKSSTSTDHRGNPLASALSEGEGHLRETVPSTSSPLLPRA